MEVFPKGCRERNNAILIRGDELLEQWRQGNKTLVWDALMKMEQSVSLAVLGFLMVSGFQKKRTPSLPTCGR